MIKALALLLVLTAGGCVDLHWKHGGYKVAPPSLSAPQPEAKTKP